MDTSWLNRAEINDLLLVNVIVVWKFVGSIDNDSYFCIVVQAFIAKIISTNMKQLLVLTK